MGQIAGQPIAFHRYDTVIVGSGAAGLNCAVHLYEFMSHKGIKNPQERIAVVTAGLSLGASRMSGSDKQTYYKIGTSPDVPDSAEEFAKTLTAAGCCHGDLALAEAIGSLREFYHLVQAGVPFPTDSMGSFIGYKTDNDPFERATSAGPKTSKFMTECLQKQLERYGVKIYDNQEVGHLLTVGSGQSGRIAGVVTIDKKALNESNYAINPPNGWRINVFLGANIVLAAGGPGELYKTSVYPKGQAGIHGLAFKAGLAGENLTESQFGLASIKFRWNVSGTYMQAIPRIFSTNSKGKDQREFLTNFFPSIGKLATNIFLKGYQWPFDPQRIEGRQSSLIDILVFNETQKGRRVFLDFLHNPTAPDRNIRVDSMEDFDISALEPEAYDYLKKAGALQKTPIERLSAMNPLAIEIYKENGIDLYSEPLEIALCAQHNNGGFAVDKWWQSNIPHTFIIGEMAATHGVKRPGGAALNAGQVGGLRAAEYIVNFYGCPPQSIPPQLPAKQERGDSQAEIEQQLSQFVARLESYKNSAGLIPEQAIEEIQNRMTASAGHIRELNNASEALENAVKLYKDIQEHGFKREDTKGIIAAIRAEHLALTSVAYLKAIVELLKRGSGSRGSHLVLSEDGAQIHPDIINGATGRALRFKPENKELRDSVLQVEYDRAAPELFRCRTIQVRPMPAERKAFEPCWRDYREGKIYTS
jgi:succinate dehydrogenase/fumarate reductase flavoprotein subunit